MKPLSRRDALKLIAAGGAIASGCAKPLDAPPKRNAGGSPHDQAGTAHDLRSSKELPVPKTHSPIMASQPLDFMWKTRDPFLFCVHHDDRYPAGNAQLGPDASLAGRNIGQDFELRDGWRMYHGDVVPGFPRHPHRGFETVTVVRSGMMDHADSMGAGARYGDGDVQWLTAGKGIQHAEMFPLLRKDAPNPVELFQIWLNLPSQNKMVDPHFSMFWKDAIQQKVVSDGSGKQTEVVVMAGRYGDTGAPTPPPNSWANDPDHDVAIWTIKMAPGARFELPAANAGSNRTLYLFEGQGMQADGHAMASRQQHDVVAERALVLENGPAESEMLMLQGRPIGEPVAHHGPFVMNTQEEIRQAFADYRTEQFGGWPWPGDDPVHGAEQRRFARHADGTREEPA